MLLSSRWYYSPVKSNLCPSKSASVICSNFAMVLFASCRISVSISGKAASIRAIVRRRSEVWYIQIKFSSSTLKFMRQTSISYCLLQAAAFFGLAVCFVSESCLRTEARGLRMFLSRFSFLSTSA